MSSLQSEASLEQVIVRARAEFLEMPGLRLTADQARRLWRLESRECEAVLGRLIDTGFLRLVGDRAYVRQS